MAAHLSFVGEHSSLMRFMVSDEEKNREMMEQKAAEESAWQGGCLIPISDDGVERLRKVIDWVKVAFQYGFVPLLIFLGWTHGPEKGCPPFSITNFFGFY